MNDTIAKESRTPQQFFYCFRVVPNNWTRAFTHIVMTIVFVGLLAWNMLLVSRLATSLRMNDFGRFYYSAAMFWQGKDMYGSRSENIDLIPGLLQGGNMNPPHFHLLLLPLALLSPKSALVLWGVISLLCLLTSLRIIAREAILSLTPRQRWVGGLGLLGFSGTAMVLVTGQLSFLLLLPVTLAWAAARKGSWSTAAGYLGIAMSVKPFLLIFLPYFVLGRRWRAVTIATGITLLCFVLGGVVFGIEAHWAWGRTLAAVNWEWNSMNASILGFLKRSLSESPGLSPLVFAPDLVQLLWVALIGLTGLFTFLVCLSGAEKAHVDRAFALLLLSALLISPLGWAYYLWLPIGPLIALAASWWSGCKSEIPAIQNALRWRNLLWLAAIPGLVCPPFNNLLFLHHRWATLTIGSIYFWSTLFLWISLIVDWRIAGGTFAEAYETIVRLRKA